jgi:hypothetical protein
MNILKLYTVIAQEDISRQSQFDRNLEMKKPRKLLRIT